MLIRILDYFFLLRPTLFFTGITIYLLAVFPAVPAVQYVLAIVVFQAVIYLYNQLYDIETDKLNNKLFFLADNIIGYHSALLFYRILLVMLFILLSFTNGYFFITISVAVVLLNYCYSHPRLNWKGKPYLSSISAFLGGSLGYLSGYFTVQQDFNLVLLLSMLPSGLAVLTAANLGMLLDYEGDRKSGKNTSAVHWSQQKFRVWILIVTISGLIVSLYQSELFFLISFMLTLLLQIFMTQKVDWQLKLPILVLSLGVCWLYPSYAIVIGTYFLLAKWYYKKRFSLNYP